MKSNFTLLAITLVQLTFSNPLLASSDSTSDALDIMKESYKRHEQFPYIYEEQIMVLIDSAGNRDTRKLRRYSRMDSSRNGRYLLLFDDPPEVRGVGLLSTIQPSDEIETGIYLPAYGPTLIESVGQNRSDNFLGTDFSVNDLLPEPLDTYHFERMPDERTADMDYFVLDVYNKQSDPNTDPAIKRHYIRKDNYYITRTDTFDRHGRIHKQLTHHDLKPLGGTMWRANMILMQDLKFNHQTLIKIARRVFSRDYVPEELFSLDWLVNNQRLPSTEANEASDDNNTTLDRRDVSQTAERFN